MKKTATNPLSHKAAINAGIKWLRLERYAARVELEFAAAAGCEKGWLNFSIETKLCI